MLEVVGDDDDDEGMLGRKWYKKSVVKVCLTMGHEDVSVKKLPNRTHDDARCAMR